jgi:hypothetical protein
MRARLQTGDVFAHWSSLVCLFAVTRFYLLKNKQRMIQLTLAPGDD